MSGKRAGIIKANVRSVSNYKGRYGGRLRGERPCEELAMGEFLTTT